MAVLEATQPLMRQAEQLAQQLADAEDEHRHALAALRTELASAHNAADAAHAAAERAAERAAAATDAAERDVRDAQAACSSKDGFVKELQGKLAAMQDERTEWEAERAELAAAIRAAEDTREAAVQVCTRPRFLQNAGRIVYVYATNACSTRVCSRAELHAAPATRGHRSAACVVGARGAGRRSGGTRHSESCRRGGHCAARTPAPVRLTQRRQRAEPANAADVQRGQHRHSGRRDSARTGA